MKKVLLLFLLLPGMVCAQVVYEDFESGLTGDWLLTSGGRWEADSIFAINGKFSLHHSFDNSESGCDQAGLCIQGLRPSLSDVEWKFKVRHAYNPSSSNNWSFFLMSDEPPAEMRAGGSLSGFALGVNLNGYNDTLCLWKIKEGTASVVLSTTLNWQNDIGIDSVASLVVKRFTGGLWEVYITEEVGNRVLIGQGFDSEMFNVSWAGFMYEYSSSQDRKLWIDDVIIEGRFEVDDEPPEVDTLYFTDARTLWLFFNEAPAGVPDRESFNLEPGNLVPEEVVKEGQAFLLRFENELTDKMSYGLHVSNICDQSGNCLDTTINNIVLALPATGDIIITEIMFDPEPSVGLPDAEYIELFNISGFDLNTRGLILGIGNDNYPLPSAQVRQGEHLLVVNSRDSSLFEVYGNILCPDGSYILNNTSDLVFLSNAKGVLIHGVEYDADWYENQLKAYGGWSLELIDYDYPFTGRTNWREAQERTGGTPGRTSSTASFNPDLDEPALSRIYPLSTSLVRLVFTETMDMEKTDPGEWIVEGTDVIKVDAVDPLNRVFDLELADNLKEGIIYELNAPDDLCDMAGNLLMPEDNNFGLPLSSEGQDIIFNEIMYDPLPGGAEYIELYNNSQKIVDISDHFMVNYYSETSDTGKIVWLSDEGRCFLPGDFYVITDNREALISSHGNCDESRIYEVASLPPLPDREGNLLLYNRNIVLIDRMHYSDEMHSPLLSVTTGVSLERISADLTWSDDSNWKSASGTSDYATPGIENSASEADGEMVKGDMISLSSRKISPDNDGFEDYLEIRVRSESEQNILTLQVFNDMGYPVRTLADKLSAVTASVFIWDGKDDFGRPVREGIYIICAGIFPEARPPEFDKKVCAVVYH